MGTLRPSCRWPAYREPAGHAPTAQSTYVMRRHDTHAAKEWMPRRGRNGLARKRSKVDGDMTRNIAKAEFVGTC